MTNSRIWVSVYVLLFCAFYYKSSAQDYNSIVNKDRKEWHKILHRNLYTNEELRKDSVAFFKEVSKLAQTAQKANDIQLVLEAKFLKYNYLSSRDYPTYLEEMQELKKEVDRLQIPQLQARVSQALGFYYYYEVNRYEKAVESFVESYQYIKKTTLSDLPDKQEMIFNIAFNYYLTGYYDLALDYLEIAKKYSNDYYPQLPLVIFNMQGMIYLDKNQLDNAILKFKEVEKKALQENRIIWVRIAQNSLSNAYYMQGKYEQALDIINWNTDEPLNHENVPVIIKKQILRSEIYKVLNQPEKALIEIEKLEQIVEENKQSINERIERPEKILYLSAYAKGLKGQYQEGYNLMSEALNETQKLYAFRDIEKVKLTETKELIDKYFNQQKEMEHINKRNKIIRIGVGLIITLLIVIFYILFQRQKIVFKKRQLQLELDKQRINQELENASVKLEILTQSLLDKNIELQNYQEELLEMEQHNIDNSVITQREEHLRKLMSAAIITDEKWIEFKKAFEKVHHNYIDNLKKKLPHLTEAEVRYLVLRKLNLTPKEIAALLAIQPDSIRLYRYRIRKKHDLEDDSSLEKIISNVP